MTIKEAIMLLNPKTTASALAEIEYYNGFSGKEACIEAIEDACRLAIEALEKQVPKRTTYIHLNTHYTHWGRVRYDQFRCCNCGLTKEFVDGHASQYKFCPQCGLEIDWSDVDAD